MEGGVRPGFGPLQGPHCWLCTPPLQRGLYQQEEANPHTPLPGVGHRTVPLLSLSLAQGSVLLFFPFHRGEIEPEEGTQLLTATQAR